jgi:hypothetical protein
MSLGEILAVSILWLAFKERDWKKFIAITLLPTMIVLFYYAYAPKYQFFFGSLSPEQLIRDNICRQNFDILFIFLISLSVYFYRQKNRALKGAPNEEILKPIPYVIFLALVLAATAVVLWLFSLHATPNQGFPITSRYFIYLMPIGVIAATILSVSVIKSFSKYRLIQVVLFVLMGLLLIQHFLKIVPKAVSWLMGRVF